MMSITPTVNGAGMGAGLYDAAFSALGSIYGKDARGPITWVTLFGGFASTVCWPLSAFLVEHLGWRGACLVYAGIQLGFALPIHLFVLPRRAVAAASSDGPRAVADYRLHVEERAIFLTLSIVLTLGAAILSMDGGTPIVPAYMDGMFEVMPRFHRVPRPGRVTLTFGEPAVAQPGEDYDQFTTRVEAIVRGLAGPKGVAVDPSGSKSEGPTYWY